MHAGELLRAFDTLDRTGDGVLTLNLLDEALRALGVRLAYDTLEEIGARYEHVPKDRSMERRRTRKLWVDYERLVDDVLASAKASARDVEAARSASSDSDRGPGRRRVGRDRRVEDSDSEYSSNYSEASDASRRRARRERASKTDADGSGSRSYGGNASDDSIARRRKTTRRAAARARRRSGGAGDARAFGETARKAAETAAATVGEALASTSGSNARASSASAQLWLKRMTEMAYYHQAAPDDPARRWSAPSSYLVGRKELCAAKRAALDAHDAAGFTPLHAAAYVDAPAEVCEVLLKHGAST